jgi:hypothetical protein
MIYKEYYKIMNWKENPSIPFELNVPQKAAKIYKGKYSEVIWEIKSKVDIPLKNDLNTVARHSDNISI